MKKAWIVGAVLLVCACAGYRAATADDSPARYPHDEVSNWGRWGADDERGAVNLVTPEKIVAAARLIQKGKTFPLAIPLDDTGPVFPTRSNPHHTMVAIGTDYAAGWRPPAFGAARFADDYIYMALQGSTQWDGLSHGWYGDELYNGFPETEIRSSPMAGGANKLGIEKVKGDFVGRGVLIDVLKHKGGSIPQGTAITAADLDAALEAQGTEIEVGDIVIIRTGVVPSWYTATPEERATYFTNQTGIGKDVVPWIKEKDIAAMAADNIGLEVFPSPEDPGTIAPLHGNILRDMGVYIGEIWWLEELAADCAEDGRYEFFISAPPLNITGAVGSPVNPIAIK